MKTRKFLAVLLSFAMTLSLIPTWAFATPAELSIDVDPLGVPVVTPATAADKVEVYLAKDEVEDAAFDTWKALEENRTIAGLLGETSAAYLAYGSVANGAWTYETAYQTDHALTAENASTYDYLVAIEYDSEDKPSEKAVYELYSTVLADKSLTVTMVNSTTATKKDYAKATVEGKTGATLMWTELDGDKALGDIASDATGTAFESGADLQVADGKYVVVYDVAKNGKTLGYGIAGPFERTPNTDLAAAVFTATEMEAVDKTAAVTAVLGGTSVTNVPVAVTKGSITAALTVADTTDAAVVKYAVGADAVAVAALTEAGTLNNGVLTVADIDVSASAKVLSVAIAATAADLEKADGNYSYYTFTISKQDVDPGLTSLVLSEGETANGAITVGDAASQDPAHPTDVDVKAKTTLAKERNEQTVTLTLDGDWTEAVQADEEHEAVSAKYIVKYSTTLLTTAEAWEASGTLATVDTTDKTKATITLDFEGKDALYLQVLNADGVATYLKVPMYVYGATATATLTATFGKEDAVDGLPGVKLTPTTASTTWAGLTSQTEVSLTSAVTKDPVTAIKVALAASVPANYTVSYATTYKAEMTDGDWTTGASTTLDLTHGGSSDELKHDLYVKVAPNANVGGATTYYWFEVTKTGLSEDTGVKSVANTTKSVTGTPSNRTVILPVSSYSSADYDTSDYTITLNDANAKVTKWTTYAADKVPADEAAYLEDANKQGTTWTSFEGSAGGANLTGVQIPVGGVLAFVVTAEDTVHSNVYTVKLHKGTATLSGKLLLLNGATFEAGEEGNPYVTLTLDGFTFKEAADTQLDKTKFAVAFGEQTLADLGLAIDKVVVASETTAEIYFCTPNITDDAEKPETLKLNGKVEVSSALTANKTAQNALTLATISTSDLAGGLSAATVPVTTPTAASIGVFDLTGSPASVPLMPGEVFDKNHPKTYTVTLDNNYVTSGVSFDEAGEYNLDAVGDAISGAHVTEIEAQAGDPASVNILYSGTATGGGTAPLTVTVGSDALSATGVTFYGTKTIEKEGYFTVQGATLNKTDIYVMAGNTPAATDLTLTLPETAKTTLEAENELLAVGVVEENGTASTAYTVEPAAQDAAASTAAQTVSVTLTPKNGTNAETKANLKVTALAGTMDTAKVDVFATANLHLASATLSGGPLKFVKGVTAPETLKGEVTVTLSDGLKFAAGTNKDSFTLLGGGEGIVIAGVTLKNSDGDAEGVKNVATLTITATSATAGLASGELRVEVAKTAIVLVDDTSSIIADTVDTYYTALGTVTVTVGTLAANKVTGEVVANTGATPTQKITVELTDLEFVDDIAEHADYFTLTNAPAGITVGSVALVENTANKVELTLTGSASAAATVANANIAVQLAAIKGIQYTPTETPANDKLTVNGTEASFTIQLAPTATVTLSTDKAEVNGNTINVTVSNVVTAEHKELKDIPDDGNKAVIVVTLTSTEDSTKSYPISTGVITFDEASESFDLDTSSIPADALGEYAFSVAINSAEESETVQPLLDAGVIKYAVTARNYMTTGETPTAVNAAYDTAKTISDNNGAAPVINLTANTIGHADAVKGAVLYGTSDNKVAFDGDTFVLADFNLELHKGANHDDDSDGAVVATSSPLYVKATLTGNTTGLELAGDDVFTVDADKSIVEIGGLKVLNSGDAQTGAKLTLTFYTDEACETRAKVNQNDDMAQVTLNIAEVPAGKAHARVNLSTGYYDSANEQYINNVVTAGHKVTFTVSEVKDREGKVYESGNLVLTVKYAGTGYTDGNTGINRVPLTLDGSKFFYETGSGNDANFKIASNNESKALTFIIEEKTGEDDNPTYEVIASNTVGEVVSNAYVGSNTSPALTVLPADPAKITFATEPTGDHVLTVDGTATNAIIKQNSSANIVLNVKDAYDNAVANGTAKVAVSRAGSDNNDKWTLFVGGGSYSEYAAAMAEALTVDVTDGTATFQNIGLHPDNGAVSIRETLTFTLLDAQGTPIEGTDATVSSNEMTVTATDIDDSSAMTVAKTAEAVHDQTVTLAVTGIKNTKGEAPAATVSGEEINGKVTLSVVGSIDAKLSIAGPDTDANDGTSTGTITFTAPATIGTYTIAKSKVEFEGYQTSGVKLVDNEANITVTVTANPDRLAFDTIEFVALNENKVKATTHTFGITLVDPSYSDPTAAVAIDGKVTVSAASDDFTVIPTGSNKLEVNVTNGVATFTEKHFEMLNLTNKALTGRKLLFTFVPTGDTLGGKDYKDSYTAQSTTTFGLAKSEQDATITTDQTAKTITIAKDALDYTGEKLLTSQRYNVTYTFERKPVNTPVDDYTLITDTVEKAYNNETGIVLDEIDFPEVGGDYTLSVKVVPVSLGVERGLNGSTEVTIDGSRATVASLGDDEITADGNIVINLTDLVAANGARPSGSVFATVTFTGTKEDNTVTVTNKAVVLGEEEGTGTITIEPSTTGYPSKPDTYEVKVVINGINKDATKTKQLTGKLTVTAGEPTTLTPIDPVTLEPVTLDGVMIISSGDGFAPAFAFQVTDNRGNPISKQKVKVIGTDSNLEHVTLDGVTAVTNENGVAIFSNLKITNDNNEAKTVPMQFSIVGVDIEEVETAQQVYENAVVLGKAGTGDSKLVIEKIVLTYKNGEIVATASGTGAITNREYKDIKLTASGNLIRAATAEVPNVNKENMDIVFATNVIVDGAALAPYGTFEVEDKTEQSVSYTFAKKTVEAKALTIVNGFQSGLTVTSGSTLPTIQVKLIANTDDPMPQQNIVATIAGYKIEPAVMTDENGIATFDNLSFLNQENAEKSVTIKFTVEGNNNVEAAETQAFTVLGQAGTGDSLITINSIELTYKDGAVVATGSAKGEPNDTTYSNIKLKVEEGDEGKCTITVDDETFPNADVKFDKALSINSSALTNYGTYMPGKVSEDAESVTFTFTRKEVEAERLVILSGINEGMTVASGSMLPMIQILVIDNTGNLMDKAEVKVALEDGIDNSIVLSGTKTAVAQNGFATFSALRIENTANAKNETVRLQFTVGDDEVEEIIELEGSKNAETDPLAPLSARFTVLGQAGTGDSLITINSIVLTYEGDEIVATGTGMGEPNGTTYSNIKLKVTPGDEGKYTITVDANTFPNADVTFAEIKEITTTELVKYGEYRPAEENAITPTAVNFTFQYREPAAAELKLLNDFAGVAVLNGIMLPAISLKLTDTNGNPMSGKTISVALAEGLTENVRLFSSDPATTDADGIATFQRLSIFNTANAPIPVALKFTVEGNDNVKAVTHMFTVLGKAGTGDYEIYIGEVVLTYEGGEIVATGTGRGYPSETDYSNIALTLVRESTASKNYTVKAASKDFTTADIEFAEATINADALKNYGTYEEAIGWSKTELKFTFDWTVYAAGTLTVLSGITEGMTVANESTLPEIRVQLMSNTKEPMSREAITASVSVNGIELNGTKTVETDENGIAKFTGLTVKNSDRAKNANVEITFKYGEQLTAKTAPFTVLGTAGTGDSLITINSIVLTYDSTNFEQPITATGSGVGAPNGTKYSNIALTIERESTVSKNYTIKAASKDITTADIKFGEVTINTDALKNYGTYTEKEVTDTERKFTFDWTVYAAESLEILSGITEGMTVANESTLPEIRVQLMSNTKEPMSREAITASVSINGIELNGMKTVETDANGIAKFTGLTVKNSNRAKNANVEITFAYGKLTAKTAPFTVLGTAGTGDSLITINSIELTYDSTTEQIVATGTGMGNETQTKYSNIKLTVEEVEENQYTIAVDANTFPNADVKFADGVAITTTELENYGEYKQIDVTPSIVTFSFTAKEIVPARLVILSGINEGMTFASGSKLPAIQILVIDNTGNLMDNAKVKVELVNDFGGKIALDGNLTPANEKGIMTFSALRIGNTANAKNENVQLKFTAGADELIEVEEENLLNGTETDSLTHVTAPFTVLGQAGTGDSLITINSIVLTYEDGEVVATGTGMGKETLTQYSNIQLTVVKVEEGKYSITVDEETFPNADVKFAQNVHIDAAKLANYGTYTKSEVSEDAESVTFDFTGKQVAAESLEILSGITEGMTVANESTLPEIRVQLMSNTKEPMSREAITASVSINGIELNGMKTVETDANGIAKFTGLTVKNSDRAKNENVVIKFTYGEKFAETNPFTVLGTAGEGETKISITEMVLTYHADGKITASATGMGETTKANYIVTFIDLEADEGGIYAIDPEDAMIMNVNGVPVEFTEGMIVTSEGGTHAKVNPENAKEGCFYFTFKPTVNAPKITLKANGQISISAETGAKIYYTTTKGMTEEQFIAQVKSEEASEYTEAFNWNLTRMGDVMAVAKIGNDLSAVSTFKTPTASVKISDKGESKNSIVDATFTCGGAVDGWVLVEYTYAVEAYNKNGEETTKNVTVRSLMKYSDNIVFDTNGAAVSSAVVYFYSGRPDFTNTTSYGVNTLVSASAQASTLQ